MSLLRSRDHIAAENGIIRFFRNGNVAIACFIVLTSFGVRIFYRGLFVPNPDVSNTVISTLLANFRKNGKKNETTISVTLFSSIDFIRCSLRTNTKIW